MPGCGFHRSGSSGSLDATISIRSAAISPIASPAVTLEMAPGDVRPVERLEWIAQSQEKDAGQSRECNHSTQCSTSRTRLARVLLNYRQALGRAAYPCPFPAGA
jgi:hypothetical protein